MANTTDTRKPYQPSLRLRHEKGSRLLPTGHYEENKQHPTLAKIFQEWQGQDDHGISANTLYRPPSFTPHTPF